jgi:hypothetical protein
MNLLTPSETLVTASRFLLDEVALLVPFPAAAVVFRGAWSRSGNNHSMIILTPLL